MSKDIRLSFVNQNNGNKRNAHQYWIGYINDGYSSNGILCSLYKIWCTYIYFLHWVGKNPITHFWVKKQWDDLLYIKLTVHVTGGGKGNTNKRLFQKGKSSSFWNTLFDVPGILNHCHLWFCDSERTSVINCYWECSHQNINVFLTLLRTELCWLLPQIYMLKP